MNFNEAYDYLISLNNLPRQEYMNYSKKCDLYLKRIQCWLDILGNPEKKSKNYKGKNYTDAAAWEYYDHSKDHYILHPETRKQLETCLLILRDEGEDACFAYIRKELLGKKK